MVVNVSFFKTLKSVEEDQLAFSKCQQQLVNSRNKISFPKIFR